MQSDQTIPVTEPLHGGGEEEPFRTPHSAFRIPGLHIPELLAPAGDWECARAAVENGADAIYFGLEKFNARMRAHNFTEADLPKLMEFLHRRGVKGYVTFNTLVFENEMAQAEQYARAMIAAGVDAAIVQDVGICRLIRQFSPDFPIHASTQMTITSAAGVEFARALGCNLVVLARECSLKEIGRIVSSVECRVSSDTDDRHVPSPSPVTRHPSLPLEVFVHGALCVAYSGQCLTSEALGGRSANRGECAQACRMPYALISDGKLVPLGDRKYLVSPQDLAGLEVLPELARLGVASLKIEGRLKSPEYVANITRIYRRALDEQKQKAESRKQKGEQDRGDSHYEMEMAFSRGLHTGWFGGINNQTLVHARFGKKRGVYLGEVSRVEGERVYLELQGPLKPGDGVVFDAGHPEREEEGGRVYEVRRARSQGRGPTPKHAAVDSPWGEGRGEGERRPCSANESPASLLTELRFGRGDINFHRVHAGDKLWKTSDPELDRQLRESFAGETPKFQRPVTMEVHGLAGRPLTLVVRDELGHVVQKESAMPLASAEKHPLTSDRLREQLGRLGGTPFKLGTLENNLGGEVLLPVSELNRMRRGAIERLETLRAEPKRWALEDCRSQRKEALTSRNVAPEPVTGKSQSLLTSAPTTPDLIVLVRNFPQLDAAMKAGVETVYCEFEDPKKYREAVSHFHNSALRTPRSAIFVAPPRIFKMGEEWILNHVRSCEADGYLIRNYDHLRSFDAGQRVGDYSLNIANRLSAEYFKNDFALERITASYDLNFAQLEALLQAAPPEWFEVTIHQHIPMFHMEHCVFCAFLSEGTDYTNCGRPCDHHDVKLRDRVGAEHPLRADAGCRNTLFNSRAQTGADYVARMITLGVRHFRLEFLNETADDVAMIISKYRQLLAGHITGPQLWRELKLHNQLGVTRGQIAGKASA